MPDGPDPTNPGITEPLSTRMAPPGAAPTPPSQQQAPQPSPGQTDMAHHALLGKGMMGLLRGTTTSYSVDPQTGKTITTEQKQTPGQWGRAMVMGAMLGLSAAAEGDAKGGSAGGFLGGLGRGGTAVQQQAQQQDAMKRAQAQEQFKNQQEAQRNQREQDQAGREAEAFKTEQQLRQATIAHENLETLHTQQLINKGTLEQYQTEADNGKAKSQVYVESGIPALATDKTEQEHQAILQANPKATAWDWEQTGWKTVMTKDKDGKDTSTYVPTFSAYDPSSSVKITQGFMDLLKKAKVDDSYPGTTDRLRVGQEMKPSDFVALKGLYQKAYNDNLAKEKQALDIQKTKAEISDYNAQAVERLQKAARDKAADKNSQLMGTALGAWDDAYQKLLKTNPNASHQDAFAKLPPGKQAEVSTLFTKQSDSLNREIKNALNQVPPDQKTADEDMQQLQDIHRMQKEAMGATSSALPKAPSKGAAIPQDVMDQYLKANPGDSGAAHAAAKANGWGDDIATAAPAPGSMAENRAKYSKAIQARRDAVSDVAGAIATLPRP